MKMTKEDVEAGAFFANQMGIHIVRNLVANGLWDERGAEINVQESIDHGTVILGQGHHEALVRVAKGYATAVQRGSSLKKEWGKR